MYKRNKKNKRKFLYENNTPKKNILMQLLKFSLYLDKD